MSEVIILAEGETEKRFVDMVLAPYCAAKGVYLHATKVHSQKHKGMGGGDVRFSRIRNDVALFLKQRKDTLVCTFVDFYGTGEWPNLEAARRQAEPARIAELLNAGAVQQMGCECPDIPRMEERYIPFTAVHEFEALLLSNPEILASGLNISVAEVQSVVSAAGGPEFVNNSPQTAPSKRLEAWCRQGLELPYRKTVQGITIAREIGIDTMRAQCPLFHAWLLRLGV